MEDCECRYEAILGPNYEHLGGNIIYCPMHANVHKLLEALKIIADFPIVYSLSIETIEELQRISKDAIAQAKGVT